jgi:hypothetical protein
MQARTGVASVALGLFLVASCAGESRESDGGGEGPDARDATPDTSPPDALTADAGGTQGPLSQEQQVALQSGGGGASNAMQVLTLVDALVALGLTLDPTVSPDSNATYAANQASQSLQGCGSLTVVSTSVRLDLGETGCTLANGQTVAGSVTLDVSGGTVDTTASPVVVAVTFETSVTVDERAVGGSASISTSDGATGTVMLDLTVDGQTLSGTLTVSGGQGTFATSGMLTAGGGPAIQLTLTDVTYASGDCYPGSGSIALVQGAVTETVTFTAATRQTGEVTVQVGPASVAASLPPYGRCPAS